MIALFTATTLLAAGEVAPRDVDAIFAKWAKPDSPGCALAVMRDGKIIYERGYGCADLERDVPITPATVFYIGSVSKQFAAAAIALLAQSGALSLDDDVRKFVPELPDYGAPITVRHLIHHTSGLRDYLGLRSLAGEAPDGVFGDAEALAIIARQKALNFPTGTQYLYSNSGYFLLSQIMKRVSGQSLRDFAAKAIFQPLGMSTAQFRDDHAMLIKNRAHAYAARSSGSYGASEPNFDVYGAGGLFMSVRDFVHWDENFYSGRVGGKEFVASIAIPGKLNDGRTLTYAFGLMVGNYRGLAIVEHGGSYGGFRAHVLRFQAQHFSVACFGNLASLEPGQLARHVADIYLANAMKAPAPGAPSPTATRKSAASSVVVPAESLRRFVGEFFSEELQATYAIAMRGEQLMLRIAHREPVPLRTVGPDTFSTAGSELKFERSADGTTGSFELNAGRVRGIRFVRR
jgi:CubicO group peptidase (beta-lactamase class C family)